MVLRCSITKDQNFLSLTWLTIWKIMKKRKSKKNKWNLKFKGIMTFCRSWIKRKNKHNKNYKNENKIRKHTRIRKNSLLTVLNLHNIMKIFWTISVIGLKIGIIWLACILENYKIKIKKSIWMNRIPRMHIS